MNIKILSEPQLDILSSCADRNLFNGGQGSGKTHIMGFVLLRFVRQFPNVLGLLAANTYGQLSDSTLFAIFKFFKSVGIEEYNESNKNGFYVTSKQPPSCFAPHGYTFTSNNNKLFFRNGAVILLASLDNYKSIDGRTVGYALLDETKDTKEEALSEVIIGRLREVGIYATGDKIRPFSNNAVDGHGVNPLYVFTSPTKKGWLRKFFKLDEMRDEILRSTISEVDYFSKTFIKDHTNYTVVCCSTFHNKANLPDNYIANLKSGMSKDMIDLNVYGSPFGKSGGEYYANFNRDKHVSNDVAFDPNLPLHITFDFNTSPYMTLIVTQIDEGVFNIIEEYCLKAPHNTIEDICAAFVADFQHLATAGVFFYGDASGKNAMPIKESRDLYKIVEKELFAVYPVRRLLTQNPRHRTLAHGTLGRRAFMNGLLVGKYGVAVRVAPSCKETIADFEFVREDANGAKQKKKVTIDGQSYEEYGHCSDAVDYMACWVFGEYNKEK